MDEHRVGLKPILRRVWAPRGQRPIAVIRPRYQWLYLMAFVHPESGRTSFWIVPRLSADIFALILLAFAAEQGVGKKKRILMVLDGAGWHTSGIVKACEGLTLITQPPYSPEVQPAERLWPLCNEPLANRAFASIDALEKVLSDRCCQMVLMTNEIRALTQYHWWPRTASPSV